MTYSQNRINELNQQLENETKKIKKLNIAHIASICTFVGATAIACAFSAFVPAALILGTGIVSSKIFFNAADIMKASIKDIKGSINLMSKKVKDELVEEKFYMEHKQTKINYSTPSTQTLQNETSLER
ncbi:MAG: hypothetical protein IJA69_03690 [Clostridia bacterium]|nr:hypothetical protein [Clostridia bacterium]